MRIHLNNPALVPELLDFLLGHVDCVAQRVGRDELEASLLGSRGLEAHEDELDRRLHVWRSAQRADSVQVTLL